MIARYRVLAERLRAELPPLAQVVQRAEGALERVQQQPHNQDYFIAAAAFDLHGFYTGVERLLELIASDVDGTRPTTSHWHHDLLLQMSLTVDGVRPAVLASETCTALSQYLRFRHVVRNIYSFNLHAGRVMELVQGLRPVFERTQLDILAFVAYLDTLSTADE